jgi:hypothetical protein
LTNIAVDSKKKKVASHGFKGGYAITGRLIRFCTAACIFSDSGELDRKKQQETGQEYEKNTRIQIESHNLVTAR